jgi:hypothetical protein
MKNRLLMAVLSILLLSWPKTAGAACSTFGGRATVVQANVLGMVPVVLSDTGNLDSTGGAKDASLLNASVPALLSGEVLHATAIGEGSHSQSEASVANLNLIVAGNTIGADFVMARANAHCGSGGTTASGSAEIDRLVVNGQNIIVTGLPNQTLSLPGGGLIILNEQTGSVDPSASITVNALHVTVPGVTDAVIASASGTVGPLIGIGIGGGCDFVTGGGWITVTPSGAKGNFSVAGGTRPGFGHLEFIDHGTGMNVHGTGVTNYSSPAGTAAEITGTAEITDQTGTHTDTYTVNVTDNGEPGTGDTFAIKFLVNSYTAGGTLGGGNIQCHTSS